MADNSGHDKPKSVLAFMGIGLSCNCCCVQDWDSGVILMDISKADFKKICEMQIKTETAYCCLCGKPIYRVKDYNIEHLTPRSRGGKDNISNWRISHKICNSKKGSLTLEEYKQWLVLERKRNGNVK